MVLIFLLIAICTIYHANYKYEIVAYGDSITYLNEYQPHLEKFFKKKILNLGIPSSAICYDQNKKIILDYKNEMIARNFNDSNNNVNFWPRAKSTLKKVILGIDIFSVFQHELESDKLSSEERLRTIPISSKTIFVLGGTNDVVEKFLAQNFYKNYNYMIEKIIKSHPESKIILMAPIFRKDEFENSKNSIKTQMVQIRSIINKISQNNELSFIDLSKCGIDSTNIKLYTTDGIHPNKDGGKIIANYILSNIE